jgi:serine/threonine protein kinase
MRYFLLMERFDGSMDDFVMELIPEDGGGGGGGNDVIYDMFPLQFTSRMLTLAADFDRHKVLHGDLKPNNFLYSRTTNGLRIVVSDFGFTEVYDAENGKMDAERHRVLTARGARMCHTDVPYPSTFVPRLNQLFLLGMIQSFEHERFSDPDSRRPRRRLRVVTDDDANSNVGTPPSPSCAQ